MKIISWNVNWIRAIAKKWFIDFIEKQNPDIFCLQETKAFESQFLKEVWIIEWYDYIWHTWTRAWYAGTAIFWKKEIEIIDTKNDFWEIIHFHEDWRITELEFRYKEKHIVLLNWYFPNGWDRADWSEMLSYKLEFYNHLKDYTRNLKNNWKDIIITWDFNICHREIDIARPKENVNSIWFLAIEREKIWEFIDDWNIDVWRYLNPTKADVYSWWSYRAGARPRNVWWRIDYFIVNANFIENIDDIKYITETKWSDHCPVSLKLK